jgi:hypothetical protein
MIRHSIRWLALLSTAIAIMPAGAHLFELPNKIGLGQQDYFVVQGIYAGWALFGIVLFAALAATLAYAVALYVQDRPFAFAAAAFALLLANLGLFFALTFPTNQATQNWTVAPENWESLRAQWEYSHAANALVIFAAFVCLLIAVSRDLALRKDQD